MVSTGDHPVESVSRQMAPFHSQHSLQNVSKTTREHTDALETLGCQILVANFITGGLKGYSVGISMLISYMPPSYGVPGGPSKEPRSLVMSSPIVSALIWEWVSLWMSASSLAIRLALLEDMAYCYPNAFQNQGDREMYWIACLASLPREFVNEADEQTKALRAEPQARSGVRSLYNGQWKAVRWYGNQFSQCT